MVEQVMGGAAGGLEQGTYISHINFNISLINKIKYICKKISFESYSKEVSNRIIFYHIYLIFC
jgi:hypothetical protein